MDQDKRTLDFLRLFVRHQQEIYAYIMTLVPHVHDADDQIQPDEMARLQTAILQDPQVRDYCINNLLACAVIRRSSLVTGDLSESDLIRDFERLCQTEDLDLVITATPWQWHVPVCVAALTAGKHAATEVPAAVTLEECWQLVETAER